jgi:hypothetical protein
VPRTIERFIPAADAGERHSVAVRAPADLVFEAACGFDLESVWLVNAIFRLRARLFGLHHKRAEAGWVESMTAIGWGQLSRTEGRELVMGAVTEPWVGDVKFRPLPPDTFAGFADPGLVKIAWTIEAEPLAPALTRLSTETRVAATDETARRKFKAYWRKFGIGIVLIRLFALPAIRREAERRHRAASAAS